jgi:hypothetical protein
LECLWVRNGVEKEQQRPKGRRVTYVRATVIRGTIFANETIKFYPRTSLASLGMICG